MNIKAINEIAWKGMTIKLYKEIMKRRLGITRDQFIQFISEQTGVSTVVIRSVARGNSCQAVDALTLYEWIIEKGELN